MAPKKKGKKGPKLTKKEKARLKQEEEERRLREEEEARIQAEREELERLERQRRQEILDRLEAKDLERRDGELEELGSILEKTHSAVVKHKHDLAELSKWERYMQCSVTPDSTVQQDVNTFISLWRDDTNCDLNTVLKKCNVAQQLMEELEELLRKAGSLKEVMTYREALLHLQDVVHKKILNVSAEILKGASSNIDTETGNMQAVIKDDNMTLCLWANLMRNHRFKYLNFGEVGMGIELTKQLAGSDIAVRILYTRYDHLSILSKMTHMTMPLPPVSSLSKAEEVPPEQGEAKENQEESKENQEEAGAEQQHETVEDEKTPANESEGMKAQDSESHLSKSSAPHPEDGDSQIQTQIETITAASTPPPPQEAAEDAGPDPHVVDLMQYTTLGGVFYCEVFHLPPQAHQVKGWEIRKLLEAGLQAFQYTIETCDPTEEEDANSFLVSVSVPLPDNLFFLEPPQVGRWLAAEKHWRTDGISDFCLNQEEGTLSFRMDSLYPFVLMLRTYANFPFRSWELRPLGQDSARFSIQGALMDLSITVKGNLCMLQSEQDVGLADLFDRWMSAPQLQRAMVQAGINVFVNEHTDKFVPSCCKERLAENTAYEQMSLFASVCTFSWSKWNSQCGGQHVIMKACEHQGPDPVPDDQWSLYLLGAHRFQKLEITETSEAFCADHQPDSEFHSTFIHMLQDNMSPEGIGHARECHFLFVDTVQSLLCATRPFMFC
ncbi:dynein axonemal intermediate chain 7-like isoform X1 [Entelurus aequoreus]|uniref:dynein axonemal intermediate chain 7-like isoform X1 n=2 Tax=Entelurus aequoreus TaxID=161455 RepID=UPI002B1D6C63|nr:dynein axonemal intermediate chain 7-like isoform X1 [Entelurus aequoreus]